MYSLIIKYMRLIVPSVYFLLLLDLFINHSRFVIVIIINVISVFFYELIILNKQCEYTYTQILQ